MKKQIIITTTIIILLSNICLSQVKKESYLFNSLYFDISYSFFWDTYRLDYNNRNMWFYEHNIFGKFSISINKSLYTGLLIDCIFTKRNYPTEHRNNYFICGIYGQYFLLNRQKFKIFGEMSLSYGDYNVHYFGISEEPYREKGLIYLGITGGMKWRLWIDKLYFKASFTWQPTISKIKEFYRPYPPSWYTHNTLNLGICYYFGKLPYYKKRIKTKITNAE